MRVQWNRKQILSWFNGDMHSEQLKIAYANAWTVHIFDIFSLYWFVTERIERHFPCSTIISIMTADGFRNFPHFLY